MALPTLSPIEKQLLGELAADLAAHKAKYEEIAQPYIAKGETALVAFANAEAAQIGNFFLRAAAEWVVSTYGPELPALVSKYEGDAYDQVVAFLTDLSK